ncbi:hypothetical protein RvVAR0630_17900 [Agrobacterium vitis]|uniref:hypothetical protein n=1 Tax=Agrobacterium vitis TaxID=373 RepID=UPI0015D6CE1D|nr:hypothetical protein [Agrobacterium vitis]BCH59166.1 hypothetical protein RvVAR0630_17900 [Agrobacterium vitis]
MTETFLPCPFCGSTELETFTNLIECTKCHAMGPDAEGAEDQGSTENAEIAWNRRAFIAVECGGEAPPVCVPNATPVPPSTLKLEPGRLYESHNFGFVEYIGLDRFYGEVTHEFRIKGASGFNSDRRYAKPEKLFDFLKPLAGSAQ